MSVELLPAPPSSPPGGDLDGERHIARASGRRFDGTVETLCGQIRRIAVRPRPNAARCEACVEMLRFVARLDGL